MTQAAPWEKYRQQQTPAGPWTRYQQSTPPPAVAAPPEPAGPPQVPIEGEVTPRSTAPAEDASFFQDPGRALTLATQDLARGASSLVGLPVDLATFALNTGATGVELAADAVGLDVNVPRIDKPIGGSEQLTGLAEDGLEAVGVDTIPYDERTLGERTVGNINTLGVEAVGTGAGLLRAAGRRFVDGVRPQLGDDLLRPYAETPTRTAVQDAGAAAGAGTSLTAAQEWTPEDSSAQTVAEFVATLFGGVTGAQLTDAARRAGPAAARTATGAAQGSTAREIPYDSDGSPTPNRVADKTARALKGGLDDAQANTVADTVAETVRDFRNEGLPVPTVGAIAGRPEIANVEVSARTREGAPFQNRDNTVRQAATDRINEIEPTGDPAAARDRASQIDANRRLAAERTLDQPTERVERANEAVEASEELNRQYGRNVRGTNTVGEQQAASGQFFDNATEKTLDPMTKEKNARFDAPDADVDITPLTDVAQRVEEGLGELRPGDRQAPLDAIKRIKSLLPKTETTDTGVLGADGKPITREIETGGSASWQELSKLRRDLSAAQAAARDAGSFELADSIQELKQGVDDIAETLVAEGGEVGEQVAEAQRYYRDIYAPVWAQKNSPNRQLRDDVQQGKNPQRETALDLYNLTGQPTPRAVQDLRNIVRSSSDPDEARAAIERYVAADLGQSVIDFDGNIDINGLRKWMENRQALLDDPEFSNIKQQAEELLQNAVNNRDRTNALRQEAEKFAADLKAAEGARDATLARLDQSALKLVMDRAPSKAVEAVMGGKDPASQMREVMSEFAGNEAATRGWRRAVADHVYKKVRTTQLGPEGDRQISLA